jgi:tetratricopeptide (TPR) repeat protein
VRAVTVALALGLAVAPVVVAQDRPAPTREQALAGLGSPDVEARRHAAAWLGDLGRMDDAPALLRALRDPDDLVRALAERSVWQVWSRSGDPEVDALFQQGVAQMARGAPDEAIATFTAVIAKKPDFAEGWNKRATIYFLIGDYERSLRDCDEVVKRNPEHFGVLAGYGQIYLALDQPERALAYFRRAVAVNPNLRQIAEAIVEIERHLAERRKNTT